MLKTGLYFQSLSWLHHRHYIRAGYLHPQQPGGQCCNRCIHPHWLPGGSAPSAQAIREIQSTLNERYNVGLDVDGIYGANTKIGLIKGLQTELNQQYDADLVVDGYWGPKTKAACPIICEGSGNIQYLIQSGLYCIAGFTSLVVNGEFTADTINAVKAFQAAKNLTPVDGRTGPDTFAALFG